MTLNAAADGADFLPLNPLDVPLAGVNLIEASAGTGKTYTIAALFLRLLLEGRRQVDQIVVVTFTNAATEELKQRIRARLVEAREVLAGRAEPDLLLVGLLAQLENDPAADADPERLARRLENAIRGFDQAAIYTIHSFCQRLLRDQAFASRMPLETELQRDDRALLVEIAEDFWRRQFYLASAPLVGYLLDQRQTPLTLLHSVRPHLGKPYLRVLSADDRRAFATLEAAFADAYARTRELWPQCREQVAELLTGAALKKNLYPEKSLPGWLTELDDYFEPQTAGLVLPQRFSKFTQEAVEQAVKKGRPVAALRHPLFERCTTLAKRHRALLDSYGLRLRGLRARLLDYCNAELERRKRRLRLQSYDDLLNNLHAALAGADGPALAERVRRRYSAALIDEFQDTDPIQYDIFRALYADSDLPVFLVGDPKQAIYSFRGADIFAYLHAPKDADRRFTLNYNWRSQPALIDAVNRLFEGVKQPFLVDAIGYRPVRPGSRDRPALSIAQGANADADVGAALQFWFIDSGERRPLNKTRAGAAAAASTASDITRLLNLAAAGRARLGERALAGGDIAVLVRNHRQGGLLRAELLKRGVASVQHVYDSVFASTETEQLERLLQAVLTPDRDERLRAALVTPLLGVNGTELYRLNHDEADWERWLERFFRYQQRWRERGFMPFWQTLMSDCSVAARLLTRPDGERRLTNLQHLAELAQQAAHRRRLGPEALLAWLARQRQAAADGDQSDGDDTQLRLESDAELVQIVTIHKSKGLEYPLVYCPFLWDAKLWAEDRNAEALRFHDPQDDHRAVLDFGSERFEEGRALARSEELAENLRLLYVALTRAQHRCTVVWGKVSGAGQAALAWLLHRPAFINPHSDPVSATAERFDAMNAGELRAELARLAEGRPRAVSLGDLPPPEMTAYRPPDSAGRAPRRARRFPGLRDGGWSVTSFSSLSAALHGDAELPDRDHQHHQLDPPPEPQPQGRQAADAGLPDAHGLPRGAQVGTCLHRLFELWPFERRDPRALRELAAETLSAHGLDTVWAQPAAELVERVLATALDDSGLRLASVAADRRLVELEFYFPLRGVTPATLRPLLRALPEPFRPAAGRLQFATLNGFMKGFIDLVFEVKGKYYIVDYKSNWLGPSDAAYDSDGLALAMLEHDYWLQYLIYTVALHRYLKLRLPGYDYRRHFGGVYYCFLRGMRPQLPASGVFYDLPDAAMIAALDRCLDGAPPEEDS